MTAAPCPAPDPAAWESVLFVVTVCASLAAVVWVSASGGWAVRLDADALRVRFLRMPVIRVPYAEILDIQEVSWWRSFFDTNFGPRLFGQRFRIASLRGWQRVFTVAPPRPEEFLAELRTRVAAARAGAPRST